MEVDEPSARLAGALKEVAAAWGRPGVTAAFLARSKKGSRPPVIRGQPLPKGATLPKGAVHYTVDVPRVSDQASDGAKPKGAAPLVVHLLLAPDGSRTWVGIGGDAMLLASRLTGAMSAPSAVRPELSPLDQANVGAGGFLNLRSLPEAVVQLAVLGADGVSGPLSLLDAVAALPHRGLTPIPFSLTAQPDHAVVATLQVPRAAIEDAIVAGLSQRP